MLLLIYSFRLCHLVCCFCLVPLYVSLFVAASTSVCCMRLSFALHDLSICPFAFPLALWPLHLWPLHASLLSHDRCGPCKPLLALRGFVELVSVMMRFRSPISLGPKLSGLPLNLKSHLKFRRNECFHVLLYHIMSFCFSLRFLSFVPLG